jgi:hypothetical protein
MKLEVHEIKRLASRLNGETLNTLYRPKPFLFEVTPRGFVYTPESGKPEPQDWKYVERFLERFNEQNSFSPSYYKDISHCASYFLAVIRYVTK